MPGGFASTLHSPTGIFRGKPEGSPPFGVECFRVSGVFLDEGSARTGGGPDAAQVGVRPGGADGGPPRAVGLQRRVPARR